jgi:hypothetical protein
VPIRLVESRVQFWNGFSMNKVSGTISRRRSHKRTTTYVEVISSMRPDSFSTTTWSSIRIGCVVAIWMPAMRLVSSGLAASPTTSPATPAEANRLKPY